MKKNKSGKKTQMRQGDLLIERVDSLPAKKSLQKDKILAHGEVTGHTHQVLNAQVYDIDPSESWKLGGDLTDSTPTLKAVSLTEPGEVIHDEHSAIPLEAGNYRVTRQREYSPAAIRNVAD